MIAFDSGVLIAMEREDDRAAKWGALLRSGGRRPLVSAVAVAESWRGTRSAAIARALAAAEVEPVDEPLARAAGVAIGATGAALPDALIAASAARRGWPLLTSDPGDMHVLAGFFLGLKIVSLNG